MIPVAAQPEPADFDANVRAEGLAHLTEKGFALDQPLPPKADLQPFLKLFSCVYTRSWVFFDVTTPATPLTKAYQCGFFYA